MTSDTTPVTQAATTDISDLLNPIGGVQRHPMPGFDDEFVDIVDYIVRITDRIWHEKKIDLCLDYYSEDSVIHTMTGDIRGAATVVANTHATLDAFPDRTLDGDNVVWSELDNGGYYSSHLITSRMTNLGTSEFGPATGKRARVRTIADCVCVKNQVVEEWLARDNAALVQQLGLSVEDVARSQAKQDFEAQSKLLEQLALWRDQILPLSGNAPLVPPEDNSRAFAEAVLGRLWAHNDQSLLDRTYDFRVGAHMPAGNELYGTLEYGEYLDSLHACLSNVAISLDHIGDIPYLGEARDIAIRWSLKGDHTGAGWLGPASGAPIYLLGMTQWRVMNGRIREETTVYDELALRRQIELFRLSQ